MRATWARRLALVAAGFALGCGGKAREASADREPPANVCSELQTDADGALQSLIEANNACETSADCTTIENVGACFTYCVVPVRRANASTVAQSGRALCDAFDEHECAAISYACPNTPGVSCIAGQCRFSF